MSLDANVFPAVLYVLRNIPALNGQAWGGTTLLKSVSEGPTTSIPDSPGSWVQNSEFVAPALAGSDLEQTDWSIDIRTFYPYAADAQNAERILEMVIEPIRAAFRVHQKLDAWPPVNANPPQIVLCRVVSGSWGYMAVNGISYRYVDIKLRVVEKVHQDYGA